VEKVTALAQHELLANGLQTRAAAVTNVLRDDIHTGRRPPGTRLRQASVAEEFGVSTTPVREAFVQLQREGLVRIEPHRGAIVRKPTLREVEEVYEIRAKLESLATERAVERADDQLIAALTKILDAIDAAKDSGEYLALNKEFHLQLYQQADRPQLVELIANLRDSSSVYLNLYLTDWPPDSEINDQHRAILEAVQAGNGKRAADLMEAHLERTVRSIRPFLDADD
jgi:DNA-binding GntR family transcriptional regulator